MAAGDIISCTIRSDGWSMDVVVDGVTPTGTTYDYGYSGTTLGLPKITLAVVSKGFDATGAATTHLRIIHATKTVRQAYPSNASLQETNNGDGTMTVRVALSEFVYAKDKSGAGNSGTDVSVAFLSGWLVKAPTTSAAASITATNNSTKAYPKIACKRAWFNFEKIQASTYVFECIPVSPVTWWNSTNRPFACVKATMTDESSNSVSATITTWGLTPRSGDPVSVVTCNHTFSLATMDKHDVCTIHFQAYPWIGDSTEVVDTTSESDRDVELTGPVKFFNDKDSDYPSSIAYVDDVSGNDGTGVAAAIGGDATASASPFKTIIAAREAIVARNLAQYGRQDLNGAVIYLKASTTHRWVGDNTGSAISSDKATRNTDKCELLITRDPNATISQVKIQGQASFGGNQNQIKTQNYRIYGLTLAESTSSNTLCQGLGDSSDCVTFHGCVLQGSSGTFPTRNHKISNFIRSDSTSNTTWSYRPNTASSERAALARGNDGILSGPANIHCLIGNRTYNGTITIGTGYANTIVWMNRLELNTSNLLVNFGCTAASARLIVVGNCFVAWGNTSVLPYDFMAENSGASGTITDGLVAYNSFLGSNSADFAAGRVNWMYSTAASNVTKNASLRFNYFRNINHKNDVFGTNAAYVTNWSETYGVCHSGNVASDQSVDNWEFKGRGTTMVSDNSLTLDFSNPTDTSVGGNNGGYVPGNSSALLNRVRSDVAFLPYDLNGHARSYDGTGAGGAYANLAETQPGGGAANLLLMGVG